MKLQKIIILAVVVMIMVGCNSKPMDEVAVTSYVNVEEREYTIILPVPTVEQEEVVVVEVEPIPVLPEEGITNVDFPFVSQQNHDAVLINDCGSATVLMVAKYFDLAGFETVNDNHTDMMGGDFPTNYIHLKEYIEDKYKLETKVIVTYEPLIGMLENAGFDTSEIELVSEIPHDQPVMWSYVSKAHWVVQFDDWVYDPLTKGGQPFENDETYRKSKGLGIVVYRGENTPTTPPEVTIAPEFAPVIPDTIRVRVTGDENCGDWSFHVEVIDLKEYVKGVLAFEWGNNWSMDSLRAGAVAVKMYALTAIDENPRYSANPWAMEREADVYDCTKDMAYKPSFRTAKTDKAVDDTWDYFLLDKDGEIFYTYFNAWHGSCIFRGEEGNCMGQHESFSMAIQGMDWKNILLTFYYNTQVISSDLSYIQDRYSEEIDGQLIEEDDRYYIVKFGDTLPSIALEMYGNEKLFPVIVEANSQKIKSIDLIIVGQALVIPDLEEEK